MPTREQIIIVRYDIPDKSIYNQTSLVVNDNLLWNCEGVHNHRNSPAISIIVIGWHVIAASVHLYAGTTAAAVQRNSWKQ